MSGCQPIAYLAVLLLTVAARPCAAAPSLSADIVRTTYGIPHVTAKDYAGLGYGAGYAFAQDNLCLLADQIVTVSGERSKYFGADATTTVSFTEMKNLETDFYFKATLDLPQLRQALQSASPNYRQLLSGYAAGYNRYLRDTGRDGLPLACRNAPWVRPVTVDDLLKLTEEKMTLASGGNWIAAIANAAPAQKQTSGVTPSASAPPMAGLTNDPSLGSNGWAFGREATGGPGILLGNPHFPWRTTNRYYQIHLTIPGALDVMGVSSAGLPGISIGFNRDVAWTHTVSSDRHFTLYDLKLDPADPTAYFIDGRRLQMTQASVSVEIKGGPPATRTFYRSKFGPMLVSPAAGLTWANGHGFTLRDANRYNLRAADTWLAIHRARNVADVRKALSAKLGLPWVNTIAADRNGDTLYADITSTPDLSAETLKACASPAKVPPIFATSRIYVLDGSTKRCDWAVDKASPVEGLTPASRLPSMIRQDFVANSNDSYWLANDNAPLTGFSPIVGLIDKQQNLRTRSGLIEIHRRLAGTASSPLTLNAVERLIFENRSYAADLVLDDVLAICADQIRSEQGVRAATLRRACDVLAKWDRRTDVDSIGVPLFVEFWNKLRVAQDIYQTPFDKMDPVNTPRGLKRDEDTSKKTIQAIFDAVALLEVRGVPLDAPWGKVQVAPRGVDRIPVHGGPGDEAGVLNSQEADWVQGVGYVPYHGTSYIQAVTFDQNGPVADGVLTYSQSTDPSSPHYSDQTWLFSTKGWNRLPFSRAEIDKQKKSEVKISE